MNSQEFENTWLNKKIRMKETSDYQLPKTEYLVTAALFEYEENDETIFAIMSNEYHLPDKPWWYTMRFAKGENLDEKLNKHFQIL